jgi:uncharacterized protein YhfF
MSPSIAQFWQTYRNTRGADIAATPTEVYHFCDNEDDANELGELVLRGEKQATTALLLSHEFENAPLPKEGDLNIITNWQGDPLCVIEITDVVVRPFFAVDSDFAYREGEGDKSLAYWRDVHRDFFTRECETMHVPFDEGLPVVCISFRCVYPKPR